MAIDIVVVADVKMFDIHRIFLELKAIPN